MSSLKLSLTPLRAALPENQATTLEVLLKITPPDLPNNVTEQERPPLNLGLVLDRSGSMDEAGKMTYAREAATYVVSALQPTDRASLTIFDDRVETLFASAPMLNKENLIQLIQGIRPRNSTDLHAGWAEGAHQVSSHLVEKGLNRVLILTDGLANAGETRPDEIATRVHAALQRGVSTSTFGLGRQYNEDLLESMARSGDGNYYYIENPNQLPQIFASELQGLSATQCTRVTLKLQTAEHVTLVDVLNELTHDAQGRWELPNLLSGVPVYVVFRFRVVPGRSNVPLARFTLEWLPAHAVDPVQAQIEWLIPTVSASDYPELPVDPQVQEKTTLLTVSRKMKEASVAADRRDVGSAQQLLAESRELLGAVPLSASISSEFDALERVQQVLDQGDMATFSKRNKFRSYQRAASKPILDHPQDETA